MRSISRNLAVGASALLFSLAGQAATLQVQVTDAQGAPLADAVVALQGPGKGSAQPHAVMDQRNKQYVPHVLAVRSGTAVSFPNNDNIRHQVYSFSPAKRFELKLYEGTATAPITFDKAGVVVLGCNIHDWMLGYIYVTDDPWFTVTDAQGTARFVDLPAGRFNVTLWHPQSADARAQPQGELQVDEKGLSHQYSLTVVPLPADTPQPPAPSAFGDAFGKAVGDSAREPAK